ncbi:MAG: thioredoxin family protein [Phycisphaerales bacterium]|nr:thioredoxin family protein [Phycisphaerales bacterium]
MARWALAALVAGTLIVFFTSSGTGSPPAGWSDNPQTALSEASETGRRVVMGFYLPGCPPCAAMEHEVLPAKPVRAALGGFVPVLVNAITNPQLAERYQVESTPTYIITDAQGNLLAKRVGYQTVDEFVAFVQGTSQ